MDWELAYRQGHTEWDRGEPTPALESSLHFFKKGSRILVPGCGTGHDVKALARAGFESIGWDIAPTAIQSASSTPRGQFFLRDFFRDTVPAGEFDGILEHTFLCAVLPMYWPELASRYHRLLRPEGRLVAILFTGLANDEPPPHPITMEGARSLFEPYFQIESITQLQKCFPGREGEETLWRMIRKSKPTL